MNAQIVTITLPLQIGVTVDEIFNYFRDDLVRYEEYLIDGEKFLQKLVADREIWLGRRSSPKVSINVEVESVVLEHYKGLDWEQWIQEGRPDYIKVGGPAGFYHTEALLGLQQLEILPATLWPLLCFGYQHQDYFRKLKDSEGLIAPGTLISFTDQPHRYLTGCKEHLEDDSVIVLRALIKKWGEGRIQLIRRGRDYLVPANLASDQAEEFIKDCALKRIWEVQIGHPPKVCTRSRPAFGDQGTPLYPRVLGIRR